MLFETLTLGKSKGQSEKQHTFVRFLFLTLHSGGGLYFTLIENHARVLTGLLNEIVTNFLKKKTTPET